MTYFAAFLAAGLVLQLAEQRWPIRSFDRKKEFRVDVLALLLAGACQLAIGALSMPWVLQLRSFDFAQSAHDHLVAMPAVVSGVLFFIVVDFLAYWAHRLNHMKWLWPTHAFHHSAHNLYWAAGQRGSPMHYLLAALPALLVQVFFVPAGAFLWIAIAYGIGHDSLIHSNLKLPRRLNWVFVTGESHFVHHGRDPRLGNSNFGFLFTFWDRLFGTYVDPRSLPPNYPLGLSYDVGYARLAIGLPAKQSSSVQIEASDRHAA